MRGFIHLNTKYAWHSSLWIAWPWGSSICGHFTTLVLPMNDVPQMLMEPVPISAMIYLWMVSGCCLQDGLESTNQLCFYIPATKTIWQCWNRQLVASLFITSYDYTPVIYQWYTTMSRLVCQLRLYLFITLGLHLYYQFYFLPSIFVYYMAGSGDTKFINGRRSPWTTLCLQLGNVVLAHRYLLWDEHLPIERTPLCIHYSTSQL